MERVGQPYTRLGTTFTYCAKDRRGRKAKVVVAFTRGGKVATPEGRADAGQGPGAKLPRSRIRLTPVSERLRTRIVRSGTTSNDARRG